MVCGVDCFDCVSQCIDFVVCYDLLWIFVGEFWIYDCQCWVQMIVEIVYFDLIFNICEDGGM